MSILVKEDTRILVQGITGDFGARHARLSLDYGSQVVAGVTPGKGGQVFEHAGKKVPIFNTVADAKAATGCNASIIYVPPPFAADAILEGIGAELELVQGLDEQAGHIGRQEVLHALAQQGLDRHQQVFGTAGVALQDGAVARSPKVQVGQRIEQPGELGRALLDQIFEVIAVDRQLDLE